MAFNLLSPAPQAVAAYEKASEAGLEFTGYVVDQANLLTADERRALTDELGQFERETGHQLAVVTVNSLGGEDIATFTTRLGNRWGVGREGIDDGIIILVAPNERRTRIAVGFGLEKSLPDEFCSQVLRDSLTPALRRGQPGAGIRAAVWAIIDRLAYPDTH